VHAQRAVDVHAGVRSVTECLRGVHNAREHVFHDVDDDHDRHHARTVAVDYGP
jgi:hypothetical protein